MFFTDRIKGIRRQDKVLEIGPGANPYWRSDVLLECKFTDRETQVAQRGGIKNDLESPKNIVFYDGKNFPFKDGEFDYVILSHVVEHVEDVAEFMREVFRVSSRGYIEYPLVYYEYLYNFDVHLSFVKYKNGVLRYQKKADTALNEFKHVNQFFLDSLVAGYSDIIDDLLPQFIEGFEFDAPFPVCEARSLEDLIHGNVNLTDLSPAKKKIREKLRKWQITK